MKQNNSTWAGWLSLAALALSACSPQPSAEPTYAWQRISVVADSTGVVSEMETEILPYRERLDSVMSSIVGYATMDLTNSGKYESTLGTFVVDLLQRQSARTYERQIDLSLMNHHGGLRAPINEGPLTLLIPTLL